MVCRLHARTSWHVAASLSVPFALFWQNTAGEAEGRTRMRMIAGLLSRREFSRREFTKQLQVRIWAFPIGKWLRAEGLWLCARDLTLSPKHPQR